MKVEIESKEEISDHTNTPTHHLHTHTLTQTNLKDLYLLKIIDIGVNGVDSYGDFCTDR